MIRMYRALPLLPLLLFGTSVYAEISGTFTASTNYLWRGVTQTDDKPAISAALEYLAPQGSYLGIWSSNTDYGDKPSYQVDTYLGHQVNLARATIDVAARHYYFPSGGKYSHDFQTDEWINNESSAFTELQVGIRGKSWTAGYAYSDNYLDSGKPGNYIELNHIRPITDGISLTLHIGAQQSKAIDDTPEYRVGDYSVAIHWQNLSLTASNLTDNTDGRQTDKVRYVAGWSVKIRE